MTATRRHRVFLIAVLLVLAAGLTSLPALAENTPPTPEIVGGQEVDPPGAYPFMVALVSSGSDAYNGQFCGGALIAPGWVLTAAHCVVDETASSLEVVIGRHDLTAAGGERIDVLSITSHPDYDDDTTVNDVAVLELEGDSLYPAVALPSDGSLDTAGRQVTVIGWGNTLSNPAWPEALREVTVPIVSDEGCSGAYGSGFEASSMLCAGFVETGGKDSCQGDSGGPLFVATGDSWTQVGIVSWGEGCALAGYPGVYSRVSALQSWITETTGVEPGGGGGGGPAPVCAGKTATIWGTEGDNTLTGTEGRDVIAGLGGNDEIDGLGGNDVICGGDGNDTIDGGAGRDKINGGSDDDTILGGSGNDRINGGKGHDDVRGGSGNDTLRGGRHNDDVFGNTGRDVLIGDGGNDYLHGGFGTDSADGGNGVDTCSAETEMFCEA